MLCRLFPGLEVRNNNFRARKLGQDEKKGNKDELTDSGRAVAVVVVEERLLVSASVWGSFGEETVDILLFLEPEMVGERSESFFDLCILFERGFLNTNF